MHDLINTRAFQFDPFVIGITELDECVNVVSTALGLQRQFAPRVRESLDQLPGRFLVSLSTIIYAEWRGPVKYEGC